MPTLTPAPPDTTDLWLPSDHNFIAWSNDPISSNAASTITVGAINIAKVKVPVAKTITNLHLWCNTVGAALSNCFMWAADPTGTIIPGSTTADLSTLFQSVVGLKTCPCGTPFVFGGPGQWLWVATLIGAGTPSVSVAKAANVGSHINVGLTAATARSSGAAGGLAGQTAAVNFTPGSNTTTSAGPNWVALS